MSSSSKDILIKPAITAGIGTLAANYLLLSPGEEMVTIFGQTVPVSVALFTGLYLASAASELAADYLIPQMSRSDAAGTISGVLPAVAVAAANAGIWGLGNSAAASELGFGGLLGVGAGSEILGDYIWRKVLANYMM